MSENRSEKHGGFRLDGKVAIVTGAAGALGNGIVEGFAGEGVRVWAFDSNGDGLRRLYGPGTRGRRGEVIPHELDVTSAGAVTAGVRKAVEESGGVDILVNNVGIYPIVPFLESTEEFFDRVIAVNLKSAFLMSRTVIPHMLDGNAGCILNIATTSFHRPMAGHVHYSTSKAGLVGLTRGLAAEFGEKGIRVNCIAPGLIMTDRVREIFPSELQGSFVEARAIKRHGRVDDIVGMSLLLCSELGSFVTGQTVVVDGGRIMA